MRHPVLSVITYALLASGLSAQQVQKSMDRTKSGPLTQITIEGKRITGNNVLVWKGTTYVSLAALAQALDASVASEGNVGVLSIPAASDSECGTTPDERKLSDAYRKAAAHIPDAIENLRAQENPPAIIPAEQFDKVDREIADAERSIETGADRSISYALSHANSTVAIAYYRLLRGVYPQYTNQEKLDSMLCSTESKLALLAGRLSGRESCSVFHFNHDEVAVSSPSPN